MRRLWLALAVSLLAAPGPVLAEEDGEELLAMMSAEQTREVAQTYIDDVWKRLDGALFCIVPKICTGFGVIIVTVGTSELIGVDPHFHCRHAAGRWRIVNIGEKQVGVCIDVVVVNDRRGDRVWSPLAKTICRHRVG